MDDSENKLSHLGVYVVPKSKMQTVSRVLKLNYYQANNNIVWFHELLNWQVYDNKCLQLRTQNELATLSAASLLCQSAMGRLPDQ